MGFVAVETRENFYTYQESNSNLAVVQPVASLLQSVKSPQLTGTDLSEQSKSIDWKKILLLDYNFTGFSGKLLLYWCYVFVLNLIHVLRCQPVIGFTDRK
jgi:hypothetical protein